MAMKFNINSSQIKFAIKDHFCAHKKTYIICLAILVLGLLTGLFTAFRFADGVTSDHITDVILVDYLKNNSSWFAMLMSRLFSYLCVVVLITMFCLNKWSAILSVLVLIYKSYLVGLNSAILIILFSVSGAINVFVVYLPCNLIVLATLLCITAVELKGSWECARYRQNLLSSSFFSQNCLVFIVALIAVVIAFILEIIFMPAFCSAFFVAFT